MLSRWHGNRAGAWYGAAMLVIGGGCLLIGSRRLTAASSGWALAMLALLVGVTLHLVATPGQGQPGLFSGVIARRVRPAKLVWAVRVLVVVTAPLAGISVALYAAALLADALRNPEPSPALDWRRVAGTGMLGLAAVLAAVALGLELAPLLYLWSVLLVGSGLAQFWSAAGVRGTVGGEDFYAHTVLRSLLGAALIAGGAVLFLNHALHLRNASHTADATIIALVALALVLGPWWFRNRGMLERERISRARATERAELADQLHDSVLQTLALIQRRADDRDAVAMLAHQQERDLRDWLLGRVARPEALTLDEGLRGLVAGIEDTFGARIELVTVGDVPLESRAEALLAAAREALVNASRHAPGAAVSVFMRANAQLVQVYIRDRGPGFDPDRVGDDRHGIRDSIIGRMRRNGGQAEVRSAPGAGCEVILTLELR